MITDPPADVSVLVEENAVFQCVGESEPIHSTVWLYNSSVLVNETKYIIFEENFTSVLTVANVSLSDSGTYICVIQNEYGTDKASANLLIQGF